MEGGAADGYQGGMEGDGGRGTGMAISSAHRQSRNLISLSHFFFLLFISKYFKLFSASDSLQMVDHLRSKTS